jgi:hypothetical protein
MIIGLMGKAGAGKDTVAAMIADTAAGSNAVEHLVRIDSFAAPLYHALEAMLAVPPGTLRPRDVKDKPIESLGRSPRYLLQTLGTEWGRQMVHPDIWMRLGMERHQAAERLHGHELLSVFTDVRFENEAQAILQRGGVLMHIVRPGLPQVEAHVSEQAVDYSQAHVRILNDGSLGDLARVVRVEIGKLLGG